MLFSATPETVFSVMSEEQIKAHMGRSLRVAQGFLLQISVSRCSVAGSYMPVTLCAIIITL